MATIAMPRSTTFLERQAELAAQADAAMNRIEFDSEDIAAANWYRGQYSMLYAIASTGALSRGTIRPRRDDGEPMTDDQWLAYLAEVLDGEADAASTMAHYKGEADDVLALEGISAKCRAAIAELTG